MDNQKATGQDRPTLKELLLGVVQQYADEVPYHPWFNERNRWRELVVCLLFAFGGEASHSARRASEVLDTLGLLNVADLARLTWADDARGFESRQLRLMRENLEQMGFSQECADAALEQIVNMARDLQSRYNGQVQAYLRKHGQQMLSSLGADFPSAPAADPRFQHGLAMWLQNVLTMPLFLSTPSASRFCEAARCSIEEMQQAADDLGISASLLDDMLDLWVSEQEN